MHLSSPHLYRTGEIQRSRYDSTCPASCLPGDKGLSLEPSKRGSLLQDSCPSSFLSSLTNEGVPPPSSLYPSSYLSRLVVGAPLETNGHQKTGDVYKCPVTHGNCTKLNLGNKHCPECGKLYCTPLITLPQPNCHMGDPATIL